MQKISIGALSALLFAATALPQSASAQDSRQGAYVNVGAAILNADFNLEDVDVQGTNITLEDETANIVICLLYTSPSPRDGLLSRMPSSA